MKKNIALMALTGVLTLASCGQTGNTPTADTTAPTVSLSVNNANLPSAGGSVVLSGTVNEASTVVVKNNAGATVCTVEVAASGTFTCPATTIAGNTSTTSTSTSYTATATDAAKNVGTSSVVTVNVAGVSNPAPTTAVLTIDLAGVSSAPITIKDANGNVVQGYDNVTVNDNATITVARGVYTVTAGNVSGFNGPTTNFRVDLSGGNQTVTLNYTQAGTTTPTPVGSINILTPAVGTSVTGGSTVRVTFNKANVNEVQCMVGGAAAVTAQVDSTSGYCDVVVPNSTGNVVITVMGKGVNGQTVTATRNISVTQAAVSYGVVTPAGDQELTLTSEGIVRDADNGWRRLGQGVSTPNDPNLNLDIYIKGTVNFSVNAPAGQKVEVFLARTTGSDVPTNDDVQAGDVLRSVASTSGTETFSLDSRRLAEFDGVRKWIVVRINGTQVTYQPVIADNKGPQQPDPELNGVQNPYSNILNNYNNSGLTYVRGDVNVFTGNPSLQDREFGQAPLGSSFVQRRPSGFESIRYYLVPETAFGNKALQESDEMLRAKAIKSVATVVSAPVLEPGTVKATSFSRVIGSGATSTVAPKALDNVTYRVYAISRDQVGNETASATYELVRFDNVGPTITGSVIRDTSDLPFASQEPERCLSDIATITLGGITDNAGGVGLNPGQGLTFTLGGRQIQAGQFDTNQLADGEYTIGFNSLTDALGNPVVTAPTNAKVYIDNTDPTVNFNRAVLQGAYASGERVSVESDSSDGGCGVYETRLFWDTANGVVDDATTTPAIGHPVQFARQRVTDGAKADSLNAGWNALQLPNGAGAVYLRALVVDRAGNATISTTPIVVNAKITNQARPLLGGFDAFKRNASAQFVGDDNVIAGVNGTAATPNVTGNSALDNILSLDSVGTLTTNAYLPRGATETAITEKIRNVGAYGRFDATQWNRIRDYQLNTDPTLRSAYVNAGNLANQRGNNWRIRTPWVELGSSDTANAQQKFDFNSDLLNDFYFGRTFGNNDSVNLFSYDQFNGIVSDTAGAYSFYGETVRK